MLNQYICSSRSRVKQTIGCRTYDKNFDRLYYLQYNSRYRDSEEFLLNTWDLGIKENPT